SSLPRDPMTGRSEFDIPVQDPVLVAEGEALYQVSCAACHGSDLRGTAIGPSHLSVIYNPDHHADGAFALAAISGVRSHHWNFGDMVPVPGLAQGDIDRIIAFIRETQRVEGFEAYPPR
ncbi:MAG: cytochrome c, partial [Acidimicrobiia bacterium]